MNYIAQFVLLNSAFLTEKDDFYLKPKIPGWHKLMTLVNNLCAVNRKCFYIEREAKTFVNSKENCKAKGGKIYEPKNAYELTGIANLAAKLGISGFVWIGIRIIYNNNNLNYANYIYDSNNQPSYFYPPWGCHLMGVPNCGKRGTYYTCLRVLTQRSIASVLGNFGKVIDSSCNRAKVFSICEL